MAKGQAAMSGLVRAMADKTGNMPLLPGIFPDDQAPIIRNGVEGRERFGAGLVRRRPLRRPCRGRGSPRSASYLLNTDDRTVWAVEIKVEQAWTGNLFL